MTREAFRKLFDTYFEELRRYIYYRSGDALMADEVVQQTFVKVWTKQPVLFPGKEKAFLYKIASDEFIDQVRREKKTADFSNDMELITDGLTPEDVLNYKETEAFFHHALNTMKENQRVTFLLNRNDGLTYREIATRLGISVKAVEKRMKSALAHIKTHHTSHEN